MIDERQNDIQSKAMGGTVFFVYIYLLVEIFIKLFTTKKILNCGWEIGLLVLMSVVFIFLSKKDESLTLPKTISGKSFPQKIQTQIKRIVVFITLWNRPVLVLSCVSSQYSFLSLLERMRSI